MSEEILERLSYVGINGIKKAELKKTFGKKCDDILKNLIDSEQIFVEKKGTAYFVWTRNNYISYLSKNDPKCKIVLGTSIEKNHTVTKEHQNVVGQENEFKAEFDRRLIESSTSIGWAPFSDIRKKICDSKKISAENFYSMASELVEKHRERYEISSGGQEGIIMRGLVHGYVRNV